MQVAGFVIQGTGLKTVLIRASGPALKQWLTGTLPDPSLVLYDADSKPIFKNDNWDYNLVHAIAHSLGAFDWRAGSLDAGFVVTLPPGSYTAIVQDANGNPGTGLVEVYEVNK